MVAKESIDGCEVGVTAAHKKQQEAKAEAQDAAFSVDGEVEKQVRRWARGKNLRMMLATLCEVWPGACAA